ncbi:unnamed protein product [Calicophoron daubneyi]|uniref:Chromo domain-containing protein n=1 Tax=Calicophoron daubneyi TaxID=300641 RepID=A0AAV2TEE1_CALDB
MQRSRSRKSDVYRVERLVGRRERGNRIEYLVKWKDWSEAHNTWEPEKNILDKRLIDSFLRREKRKKLRNAAKSANTSTDSVESDQSSHVTKKPALSSSPTRSSGHPEDSCAPLAKTTGLPLSSSALVPPQVNTIDEAEKIPSPKHSSSTPPPSPILSQLEKEKKNVAFAHTTPSSIVETPLSPASSHLSSTSSLESNELVSDRRFRRTTLLVAAASASAANAAAALASSRNAVKQNASTPTTTNYSGPPTSTVSVRSCSSTATQTPSPAPPGRPSSTDGINNNNDVTTEERPKIRLTIPRERLLPCPPPGVPSSSSSGSQNSSQLTVSSSSTGTDEDLDHSISTADSSASILEHSDTPPPRFLAPVEIPRRATTATSPLSLLSLRTAEPVIEHMSPLTTVPKPNSPKWQSRTKQMNSSAPGLVTVPKFVLFNSSPATSDHKKRRHDISSPNELSDEQMSIKKRKHLEKKEKRRRRKEQLGMSGSRTDTELAEAAYDIQTNEFFNTVKIRRRSGSSASCTSSLSSGGFSPTGTVTAPSSGEDTPSTTPRLAPLRIQLPKSFVTQLSAPGSLSSTTNEIKPILQPFKHSRRSVSVIAAPPLNRLKDTSNSKNHHRQQQQQQQQQQPPPPQKLTVFSPDAKRLRLVQEICVTDVTVDGLTISIKECTGPDDFFGVPSSQLVQFIQPTTKVDYCDKSSACVPVATDTKPPPQQQQQKESIQNGFKEQETSPYVADENTAPLSPIPSSPIVTRIKITPQIHQQQQQNTSATVVPYRPSTRGVCDLSTITEESTVNSSPDTTSSNRPPSVVLQASSESSVTMVDVTGHESKDSPGKSFDSAVKSEKPEIPTDSPSSHSTSALLLAATEAALKSASESPTSPGILMPPRRCSTPVEHLSPSENEPPVPSPPHSSTNPIPQSPNNISSTPAICSQSTRTNTLTVRTAPTSLKRFLFKPNTNSMGSKLPVSHNGAPRMRLPTIKIYAATSETPRRSRLKQPAHDSQSTTSLTSATTTRSTNHQRTLKFHTFQTTASKVSSTDDPASIYTFPGSSPPCHLSLRTVCSRLPTTSTTSVVASSSGVRSSPLTLPVNSSLKIKSPNVRTTVLPATSKSVDSHQLSSFSSLATSNGLLESFSLVRSQQQHYDNVVPSSIPLTPSSLDLSLTNLANSLAAATPGSDAALATAVYLQQLQMQLFCSDPATTATNNSISHTTAISELTNVFSTNTSTSSASHIIPSPAPTPTSPWSALLSNNFSNPLGGLIPTTNIFTDDPSVIGTMNGFSITPTAANLALATQIHLADMVAAAAQCNCTSNVFEIPPNSALSSFSVIDPTTATVSTSAGNITSTISDDSPIDLSAKR